MNKMKGPWCPDSFNNVEANAIMELISCMTDANGDLSMYVMKA